MVLTSGREGTFPPRMGLCGEGAEQARLESSTGVCHSSASVLPLILWTPSKPAEQPPRWMPSRLGLAETVIRP